MQNKKNKEKQLKVIVICKENKSTVEYCKIAENPALAHNFWMTKSSLFNYRTCKIAEKTAIAVELRVPKFSAIAGFYCTYFNNKIEK